jgi:hypothetical protein
MPDDQFSAIRDELRQLARLDPPIPTPPRVVPRSRVFGAGMHRYRSSPVSNDDIEALEAYAGAALPEDFRRFLLTVGSGAGPYYGIATIADIRAELEDMRITADLAERPPPRPDLPFPLTREQAAEALAQWRMIRASAHLDGCLIIGHQGSGTQWSVLAVSGPLAGTMWDLAWFGGFDAEWFPARPPPGVQDVKNPRVETGCPPMFLEWFRAWIERARSPLLGPRIPKRRRSLFTQVDK